MVFLQCNTRDNLSASTEGWKRALLEGCFLPSLCPCLVRCLWCVIFAKCEFLLRYHGHILMSTELCIVSVPSYSIEPFPAICRLTGLTLVYQLLLQITSLLQNAVCPALMDYTLGCRGRLLPSACQSSIKVALLFHVCKLYPFRSRTLN